MPSGLVMTSYMCSFLDASILIRQKNDSSLKATFIQVPVLPGPSIMLILSSAIHSLPHQLRYLLTLSFRNLMGFLLYVISIYNNAFFWIFIIIFLFLPQRFLKIISCMLTRVILVICYYIIECTCCVLTFAFLRIHTGGHLCRTWKLQIHSLL